MKIICVADLHENLPEIPECDLLLIAGDITYAFHGDMLSQRQFLDKKFRKWLERVPAKHVVGIAGNHDQVFQKNLHPKNLPWTYLQDSYLLTEGGIRIYGTPWQPWFYDWAFNAYEPQLDMKWEHIPENIDIILVHGPPYGYGDKTGDPAQPGVGSKALLKHVERVKPKLVVCGHIHSGYGMYRLNEYTDVVNCALVDNSYQPVNKPVEINYGQLLEQRSEAVEGLRRSQEG